MSKDVSRANPLVSVVLSFRNESDNIPELVRRLRAVFQKIACARYELVFVNDDSTDSSERLLRGLAAEKNDIVLVSMSRKFGVSECVMAGLRHAKGDAVVYMDADLQDPPELIEKMLEEWRADADVDVVYTTRLSRAGESRIKLFLTRIGYKILRLTSNIQIVPDSGDYKLLSRRVVDEVLKLQETKPFMRGLVTWVGFKQKQVLYHREARYSGETKFHVFGPKVIYNFLDSALISFSDMPLKLALLLGGMMSFLSFLYLIWVFIQKFIGWALPGWSAIMATMLMLGGVQLFMMGVLGLYINAIYLESKKRPLYIIKDVYDSTKR